MGIKTFIINGYPFDDKGFYQVFGVVEDVEEGLDIYDFSVYDLTDIVTNYTCEKELEEFEMGNSEDSEDSGNWINKDEIFAERIYLYDNKVIKGSDFKFCKRISFDSEDNKSYSYDDEDNWREIRIDNNPIKICSDNSKAYKIINSMYGDYLLVCFESSAEIQNYCLFLTELQLNNYK